MNAEASASAQEHTAPPSQPPHLRYERDYTSSNGVVVKAIRHEHLRSELLQQAEARLRWTHPQPQGVGPHDRTSPVAYPPDQRNVSCISIFSLSSGSRMGSSYPMQLKTRCTTA